MNREQIEFLRAREIEAYFNEKVDLGFKGMNGVYSEFSVTHINNREVKHPVTVGFCQFPDNARLYLDIDLTDRQQGSAKIELDLSQEKLRDLREHKDNIMVLNLLQSAIADRPFANAENLTNQPFWMDITRDIDRTFEQPGKQIGDLARRSFRQLIPWSRHKQHPDTVKQGSEEHFRSYGDNRFAVNPTLKDTLQNEIIPSEPIIVRASDIDKWSLLGPNMDYALSFTQSCERGYVQRQCVFTPVNETPTIENTHKFEYENIHITSEGVDIQRESNDVISLTFSERTKEQEQTKSSEERKDNDRERTGDGNKETPVPSERVPKPFPEPYAKFMAEFEPKNQKERVLFADIQFRRKYGAPLPALFSSFAQIGSPDVLRSIYERVKDGQDEEVRKFILENPRCPADISGRSSNAVYAERPAPSGKKASLNSMIASAESKRTLQAQQQAHQPVKSHDLGPSR